ncbi:MAG: metalloregulator ArsR/SmtB family transcription factor [Dehalococcoidia bacterium]|nr:metalloregulator ArsR/SmtB family transcription factor [Dehalococcoidia bacterium]
MDLFEALADPTRRAIVEILADGERSAGHISDRFDIAGPSVSRHLKVLRESGLVAVRKDAQSRIYQLRPEPLDEVRAWMQARLDRLHSRFDALGAHLDQMKAREEQHGEG